MELATELSCPPAAAYAVLSDTLRFPEWCPHIEGARVLVREGDVSVVEFSTPLSPGGRMTVELVHDPPVSVSFRQADSYRGGGFAGTVRLAPGRDGSSSTVTLSVSAAISPFQVARRRAVQEALSQALDSLCRRVAAVRDGAGAGDGRTLLLEVVRRDGVLELSYRGRRQAYRPEPSGGGER